MNNDRAYYRLGFKIIADFGGAIAVPVVISALVGKWLDVRFGTNPLFILLFLFIALFFTSVLVAKKSKKYKEEYESLSKEL